MDNLDLIYNKNDFKEFESSHYSLNGVMKRNYFCSIARKIPPISPVSIDDKNKFSKKFKIN